MGLKDRDQTQGTQGGECAKVDCQELGTVLIVQTSDWSMLFNLPYDSAWMCEAHAESIGHVGGIRATEEELLTWRKNA